MSEKFNQLGKKEQNVMKKCVWTILTVVMAVVCVAGSLPAKEAELKLASWGPAQHFVAQARGVWINEVNQALAGRYKIVDYPGGQLYGPSDVHKAVAKGLVDIGVILQPAMLAMVPMVQGVYLPFAFESVDDVAKAYSGESLSIIEKAMEKKRLKLIYTSYLDPVQIFSNKGTISTIEDFKGLRVLSSSPIFSEIMVALGAAPDASIPQTEWYMALKRSVSDSMATSIVGGYFQKSFEVAPYITKMNMSHPTILVCMNLKVWKKLPGDVQETLVSLGKKQEAVTLATSKGWEQKFTGELSKIGATVATLAPEERNKIIEVSSKYWNAWADENGKDAKRLLEINCARP